MVGEFETVGDLIDHLEKLGRDRALIVDVYGNTFPPTEDDIGLWDPDNEDSPVAITCAGWFDPPTTFIKGGK